MSIIVELARFFLNCYTDQLWTSSCASVLSVKDYLSLLSSLILIINAYVSEDKSPD